MALVLPLDPISCLRFRLDWAHWLLTMQGLSPQRLVDWAVLPDLLSRLQTKHHRLITTRQCNNNFHLQLHNNLQLHNQTLTLEDISADLVATQHIWDAHLRLRLMPEMESVV